MPQAASLLELRQATNSVRDYVDEHEVEPYSTKLGGDFLICYAELKVPRVIGERTAKFLRLFKAVSGNTLSLAGAIYNEAGFKAWPDSEVLPEMPVRSMEFKLDLPSSTHVFNGNWDAHEYPITSSVANELVEDVATATPHKALPRPALVD